MTWEKNLFSNLYLRTTQQKEKYLIFLQANISISMQDTYRDKYEKIHMDRYNNQEVYTQSMCSREGIRRIKNICQRVQSFLWNWLVWSFLMVVSNRQTSKVFGPVQCYINVTSKRQSQFLKIHFSWASSKCVYRRIK